MYGKRVPSRGLFEGHHNEGRKLSSFVSPVGTASTEAAPRGIFHSSPVFFALSPSAVFSTTDALCTVVFMLSRSAVSLAPTCNPSCEVQRMLQGWECYVVSPKCNKSFHPKEKALPFFLASPLHGPNESHRATCERLNGKLREDRL